MALGFHVHRNKQKIHLALANAAEILSNYGIKNKAAQIFATGPQSYRQLINTEDFEDCKKTIREYNIKVLIHGAYVDTPWNNITKSIDNIVRELNMSDKIGAEGVIIHLSNATNNSLCQILANIDKKYMGQSTLWLEINSTKSSPNSFETPQKINKLFSSIRECKLKLNIGLCIDTAHLYACGVSFANNSAVQSWFAELDNNINIMIHLNDNLTALGAGYDRHELLGHGQIWKHQMSGLIELLNIAETKAIIVILERDDNYVTDDIELIRYFGFFQ